VVKGQMTELGIQILWFSPKGTGSYRGKVPFLLKYEGVRSLPPRKNKHSKGGGEVKGKQLTHIGEKGPSIRWNPRKMERGGRPT